MTKLGKIQLFIDGEKRDSADGSTFGNLDPAKNEVIATVAEGKEEDINEAVTVARRAFEEGEWRYLNPSTRGELLHKIAKLVEENFDDLARTETLDCGKPLHEARPNIEYVMDTLRYYAGVSDKIQGDTIPVPGNRLNYTVREPVGVVGVIVPWNYPLLLAVRSIAPALATGNSVVVKPAEETPLTAIKFASLAHEAGLPNGVLNVVAGFGETAGTALASHPIVDKMAFTGSVSTGKKIMKRAAENLTGVTLEMGGKSPNIVFEDANIEKAVQGTIDGIFYNAGQMCWAGARLLVHKKIKEDFMKLLVKETKKIKVGPGLDPQTKMGPLVSKEHLSRVMGYIQSGIDEGASILIGGDKPQGSDFDKGNFVNPTIFTDVKSDMKIAQEEIFGPVLCVFDFETVEEAIRKANNTQYGLYAGIWTKDLSRAHEVASRLEAGIISINEYSVTFPQTPFIGHKESGISFEQGFEVINFYTKLKNVSILLD